ncbi:MAG: autotransporter outer membrane beta-barrel domain-containing protein [Verrucomicrobiota bacterium]
MSISQTATFVVGDATSQVGNPVGLTDGDTINFVGTIISTSMDGFDLTPVPSGITLNIFLGATVSSITTTSEGIDIDTDFDGTINVLGTVSAGGFGEGIDIDGSFTGAINIFSTGIVTGGQDGIDINGEMGGSISNTGTIIGSIDGIAIRNDLSGMIENTGSIIGGDDGIFANGGITGNIINSGTISGDEDGIDINGEMGGSINNIGIIIGSIDGIAIRDDLSGMIKNTGSIIGGDDGIFANGGVTGYIFNSGFISGNTDGIDINRDLTGTLINWGLITGTTNDGIRIDRDLTGIIDNSGTITGAGDGIRIRRDLIGSLINNGMISGGDSGIEIDDDVLGMGSITNSGTIFGGVDAIYVDDDFRGTLTNTGSIGGTGDGISIENDLEGSIFNSGTIFGPTDAIFIGDCVEGGMIVNSGTITSSASDGIDIVCVLDAASSITNSGTIFGGDNGIEMGALLGTITNSGIIEGGNRGIIADTATGIIRNEGGRIEGTTESINLGTDSGLIVLSGPSHIIGTMNGAAGAGDVLRFENMRGITNGKAQELAALAAADSTGFTTVTLFGELVAWINFEDIQFDFNSAQAYQDLITDPRLAGIASSLDDITGLDDDFRELLSVLNDLDVGLLNDAVSNMAGVTLLDALQDFIQSQDTTLFTSLTQQLSNARNGNSGFNANSFSLLKDFDTFTLQNLNNNLIALDAQGVSDVSTLDRQSLEPMAPNTQDWNVFLTGYGGVEFQDSTSERAERTATNATILFGGGSWLTENLYAGAFTGYTRYDANVDRFGSDLTDHAGYFGVNLQYTHNHWFASVAAAYGFHNFHTNRWDVANVQHKSDTIGHQALVFGQVGYDWYIDRLASWRITPYAGVAFSYLSFSGFTETGGSTGLKIHDGITDSLQSTIGFETTKHFETTFGWIRPYLRTAWWHSFLQEQTYNVNLATSGLLNGFDVESASANEDRASVSLGASFAFEGIEEWVMTVGYQGSYGTEGYQSHTGTAGIRYGF